MDYPEAIILGVIQGLSEWLPVSSEAMVTLTAALVFGLQYGDALSTAIWLHSGTMVSAIAYFRQDIREIIESAFRKQSKKDLLVFLAVSTIISGILGVMLLWLALNIQLPVWAFTVVIGLFLIAMGILQKNRSGGGRKTITAASGMIAGIAQGLAAVPGISRSGITLAALLAQRYSLRDSLKLSFLMSIPAIIGIEILLPALDSGFVITGPLLAGGMAAAVVGFLTMKSLLAVAARKDFYYITIALGAVIGLLGLVLYITS